MMRVVELPPIKENPDDYEELRKRLDRFFRDEIYIPLLKAIGLPKKVIKNSINDLAEAISTGRISYSRGQFTGAFNSVLSRELKSIGAKWDRKQGSWKIPQSKLPLSIRSHIAVSENKFTQILKSIDRNLQQILPAEISDKLQIEEAFDKTLWKKEKDFQRSVNGIMVAPQLTDHSRAKMAKEYADNLRPYVKDFMTKEIESLRKKISENVLSGNRYENLVKEIQRSYQVSNNKAKFLARQETGLMMSKFREARAKDIGSPGYIWKNVAGSALHPVRHDHKLLDNTFHRWDDPPITNQKTGARNHPGQDFNCRCYPKTVVKF